MALVFYNIDANVESLLLDIMSRNIALRLPYARQDIDIMSLCLFVQLFADAFVFYNGRQYQLRKTTDSVQKYPPAPIIAPLPSYLPTISPSLLSSTKTL